jgi:hypothetical protein
MATQKITRKQIESLAATLGLDTFTYSPGDGVTRYKFAPQGTYDSYFGYTAIALLGVRDAETFLRGVQYAGIFAGGTIRL